MPVFAADGDGPDGVLDGVVVDRVTAIVKHARQRMPAFERIADGTGQAGVAQHGGAEVIQPAFEVVELGREVALPLAVPGVGIQIAQFRFDGVERADAFKRFFRQRAGAGLVHVEELASRMRPAGQFGDATGKQRLVAAVIVDQQRTLPVVEEARRMLAGAAGAVIEQDDRRTIGGTVRKEVGAFGLASARVELCHRRLVGVQHGRVEQAGAQGIDQRLQRQADHADPFGQRRARQCDAVAREDRFLPVQRQVVGVLLDRDLGQQARGGEAAVEDRRGDGFGDDRLAGAAGVLRMHLAAHEEGHRLDVELLADVFADLHQRRTAGGAVAGGRLVDRLDARQLGWQRAAWRGAAFGGRLGRRRLERGQLRFQRGDVRRHRLVEQLALRRIHALGLGRELHAAQTRDLVRELADLRVLERDRVITLSDGLLVHSDHLQLLHYHRAQRLDVRNVVERCVIHGHAA